MKREIQSERLIIVLMALLACVLVVPAQKAVEAQSDRTADEAAIRENVREMEQGWNTKSGATFAKPFAEDADYVVINGMHIQGRAEIEKGHQRIFDTIFKNTTLNLNVKQIRFLRPDVALVHVAGISSTPQADAPRESNVIISLVMTKDGGVWKIKAFQNTEVVKTVTSDR